MPSATLINHLTDGFIGRKFLFDKVDAFLDREPQGYVTIEGDPGIGKSAFAAQLVQQRRYIHHFNVRSDGISRPEQFMRNIGQQLVDRYQLDIAGVRAREEAGGASLLEMLNAAAARLPADQRLVIVVDALDEAEPSVAPGVNRLYLPKVLPPRVFFIITQRRGRLLRADCMQDTILLASDDPHNLQDIHDFLERQCRRSEIRNYLDRHAVSAETFTEELLEKSEGNFIYVRYVMFDFRKGSYDFRPLASLPSGLKGYYEEHWDLMKGRERREWEEVGRSVVMALAISRRPFTLSRIAEVAEVEEYRVAAMLETWQQFICATSAKSHDKLGTGYRLYHESFRDFVATKPEVMALERAMAGKIAATLERKVFTNGSTA